MPDDYPGPGTVGTLRSQSVLKQSLAYSVSILRINRQIYEEALATFGENKWILVNANNAGYGSALKEHGFPVVSCRESEFMCSQCGSLVSESDVIFLGRYVHHQRWCC